MSPIWETVKWLRLFQPAVYPVVEYGFGSAQPPDQQSLYRPGWPFQVTEDGNT